MTIIEHRLVNTMSVESPYGFRTINLNYGDICDSRDELLVASSHANPDLPPGGAVVHALADKYGLDFSQLSPLIVLRGVFGTHRLEIESKIPYKQILVVRIPGALRVSSEEQEALKVYEEAVWSVFGSLAALELHGTTFQSMSLPLLGGQRQYPISNAMEITLRYAIHWLRTSRFMQIVNFYVFKTDQIHAWTEAMNRSLGRRSVDTARDHILRGLRDEILSHSSTSPRLQHERIRDVILPIEHALRSSDVFYLQQITAFGRVLVERIVQIITEQLHLKWQGSLLADIDNVRKAGVVAPWMINHFHSLRILGNETVHTKGRVSYQPDSLQDEDIIPVLCSLLRILTFWNNWDKETENTIVP